MALKVEIVSQLQAAGIAFDENATKAELEALLPADQKAAAEASDAEQEAREAAEEKQLEAQKAADDEAAKAAADAKAAEDAANAASLAQAVAEPSTDEVTVQSIITPQEGDNEEQTRLRGVFKAYFEQMPERATWTDTKVDMINQIARAGVAIN